MTIRVTLKSSEIEPTDFGYMVKLKLPQAKKYDGVILCYNQGQGLKPIQIYLTHQVYLDKLEKICEQYGGTYNFKIVAIPVCSEDYIEVLNNKIDRIVKTVATS
jgi:hypothetical protein